MKGLNSVFMEGGKIVSFLSYLELSHLRISFENNLGVKHLSKEYLRKVPLPNVAGNTKEFLVLFLENPWIS